MTAEIDPCYTSLHGQPMAFYRDRVYPAIVKALGDPEPIRAVRKRLIPRATGIVLEIGVGPGVNFEHYDAGRVKRLYALEPNPGMVRYAERQRAGTRLDVSFLGLPGERIPLETRRVDGAGRRCIAHGPVRPSRRSQKRPQHPSAPASRRCVFMGSRTPGVQSVKVPRTVSRAASSERDALAGKAEEARRRESGSRGAAVGRKRTIAGVGLERIESCCTCGGHPSARS